MEQYKADIQGTERQYRSMEVFT